MASRFCRPKLVYMHHVLVSKESSWLQFTSIDSSVNTTFPLQYVHKVMATCIVPPHHVGDKTSSH